jgi:hypothetical protein
MNRVLAALGVLFGLLLLLIAGLFNAAQPSVDVPLEVAKGLITLAAAVLVTGVLSFVLSERNRELARQEERVRVLAAARQDFKAAYEQAHTVRFLLAVHPSAKTLDEQSSELMRARERLQRVQRERFIRENTATDSAIQAMLDYLKEILREYGTNYLLVTYEKLAEEAEHRRVVDGENIRLKDRSLLSDPRFAALAAFISDDEYELSSFAKGYQDVKEWLEEELIGQPTAEQPQSRRARGHRSEGAP